MCPFKVGDIVKLKPGVRKEFYHKGGKITSISPCGNFIRFQGFHAGWSFTQYEKVEDMATKKEHFMYVVYNKASEHVIEECGTLKAAQESVRTSIEDEYDPVDKDDILILVPFQKVKEVKVEFEDC